MINKKFGTFLGVFVPNVTMMFGVILFLRLGIITSHIGLQMTLLIIMASVMFMFITCLSISSITSSMDMVGAGGVYYLVSRTLGIEIGGALGIVTLLSQILSLSLTTNAFSFLLGNLYPNLNIQLIEIIVISVLSIASIYSADLALKLQVFILALILAAIISVISGNVNNLSAGAIIKPLYDNMSFWFAFSMFYPAVTGIEIGMSLSGTLKNPSRSILIGNITSLCFVAITYVALVVFAFYKIPLDILASDPLAFAEYAFSKKIVILGISAATLSSSLGSLIGGPRILQTMAEDGIMPKFLAKVYGKHNEPRYALILTAIIAITITISTSLEQIIPVLTMNCLITYGLLNFISGINTLMNTTDWRPTFKIHYLISFSGVVIAIVLMFMINAGWSFISILLLFTFCIILHKRNIVTTFSDIRNSLIFFLSRYTLYKLSFTKDGLNTWHPVFLILAVTPSNHLRLAKLAHNMTKQNGILIFGTVLPKDMMCPERLVSTRLAMQNFLEKRKIKALTEVNFSTDSNNGFINLIKSYGIGSIQPNTILLPIEKTDDVDEKLFNLLSTCYLSQKNIVLFQDGERFKETISSHEVLRDKHQIDLWWDSTARESSSLLVSLVSLLHSSHSWKKAKINLKCVVNSENAIPEMQKYLEKFIDLSRLKMQVQVYNVNENFNLCDAINQYSKKAVAVFIPLLFSTFDEESQNTYREYLIKLLSNNKYGARILCCSLDKTEHTDIYSYPSKRGNK